jgi:NitT/TauT family transport system permease protein
MTNRESPWRRRANRFSSLLPGLILPLVLLVWWQLAAGARGTTSLLPAPGQVLDLLLHPTQDQLATGSLLWNTTVSLVRVAMGFGLAAIFAIPTGILMGYSRYARKLLSLTMEMARPLSPIALVPLALILFRSRTFVEVFGLTHLRYQHHILHEMQVGMVFILFWGGFFPILLGTIQGVRSVRSIHLEAAKVLGAKGWLLFRRVVLPAALPDVFTGLRLGIGRCWMVIIAAEMLPGTNAGLGYLIRYSYEVLRIDVMLACLIIVAVFGAIFSRGLAGMGERSLVLRHSER